MKKSAKYYNEYLSPIEEKIFAYRKKIMPSPRQEKEREAAQKIAALRDNTASAAMKNNAVDNKHDNLLFED